MNSTTDNLNLHVAADTAGEMLTEVAETMLGLHAEVMDASASSRDPQETGAYVTVSYETSAVMLGLTCSLDSAEILARALMGLELDEEFEPEDRDDVLMELANIVGGGVKDRVGQHLALALGVPMIITSEPRGNGITERISRNVQVGEAWVTVVVLRVGVRPEVQRAQQMARELAERNRLLQAVLETSPDSVLTVAQDGQILSMNTAARAMFQITGEPKATSIDTLVREFLPASPTTNRAFVGLRGGETFALEASVSHFEIEGQQVIAAVMRDVTARKAAEYALREAERRARQQEAVELQLSQRLESVGQLAAGLAHEINTPLQYVGDNLSFINTAATFLFDTVGKIKALEDTEVEAEAYRTAAEKLANHRKLKFIGQQFPEAIEEAFAGVREIAGIIHAVREFSKPSRGVVPTDINDTLEHTLTVTRREYRDIAQIERDFEQLPNVPCQPGDLGEVFRNLIINAAHAIADRSDAIGTIRIATRCDTDQGFVTVAIEDTGCGIPSEISSRVFDPFFTTKPVGSGVGQGLAISRSVVDRHGGRLWFESEPGKGTTFHVHLPLDAPQSR